MKRRLSIVMSIIVFILMTGSVVSSQVLASDQKLAASEGILSVDAGTLTLKESEDGLTWTDIIGTLATGYSMVLDPVNTYEYLDIANMTATPTLVDGNHEFYFDAFRAPDGFWDYWAAKGVVKNATGWQGLMWEIISGDQPMFYLNAASGAYSLVDGFQFQWAGTVAPLRVNGDYPLGTYHFGGYVNKGIADEEYLNIQITFTKEATVSVTPQAGTIDGCGFVDVYLHLADVHDLYAVDVELSFDPDVLEVVDLWESPDEPEVNFEPINTWFQAGYWVHNEADNTAGTIRYAATQTNTAAPVDGSDNIARIRFIAKSIGSSDITITKAELSDRDGYLVGRPVNEVEASITTDFSAAAGVEMDISRLNVSTVQLSWPEQTVDTGAEYLLHRSTLPYFDINDQGVVKYNTGFVTSGATVTYDDEVLGDVGNNYFYALQVVCSNGFKSPVSDQVGKFEYELYETATTDFTWVGLVLQLSPELEFANDLVEHIEANNNSSLSVLSISGWDPSSQQINLFIPTDPTSTYDFPVSVRSPYRIEVDVTGGSSSIWAQVGKLPPIEYDTYTLYETATTDFNWILQPLDLTDIKSVDDLASHVTTNASSDVSLSTVSSWNAISQQYDTYFVGEVDSIFPTRFGYPYRLEVNVTNGTVTSWP